MTIPASKRSKAMVCGRSLAGVAGSNPAGAWMFVLCVLHSKDKRHSQDNHDKEVMQISKENFKKSCRGHGCVCCVVLCVVSKDKRQNAGQSGQRNKNG